MKFKDNFTAQAAVGIAINAAMNKDVEYRTELEKRLPEMEGKGQAESLRIKLRILLEMLGEPEDKERKSRLKLNQL